MLKSDFSVWWVNIKRHSFFVSWKVMVLLMQRLCPMPAITMEQFFFCTYPHIRASKQSCLGGLWTILWLHASTVRSYTEYTYVYRSKVCSINWIHDMWNPNKAGEIFKKIIGGKIIDPNFEFHDKGCKYFCSHNFFVVIFNSWGEKNTFHIMSNCF